MINKISKFKGGFTVLESIVAIAILSLSITGILGPVQRSLSQAGIAKDEVKAYYMALEGIEVVRNLRDQNQLKRIINGSNISWMDGITEGVTPRCPYGRTCAADVYNFTTTPLINCVVSGPSPWGSCQYMWYHENAHVYGYWIISWKPTTFKRELQIESINANEISVTVRVLWTTGSVTKEFKAKTHLFNWI